MFVRPRSAPVVAKGSCCCFLGAHSTVPAAQCLPGTREQIPRPYPGSSQMYRNLRRPGLGDWARRVALHPEAPPSDSGPTLGPDGSWAGILPKSLRLGARQRPWQAGSRLASTFLLGPLSVACCRAHLAVLWVDHLCGSGRVPQHPSDPPTIAPGPPMTPGHLLKRPSLSPGACGSCP